MSEVLRSFLLLFALLNPFLVVVYLVDVIASLDRRQFITVMLRAGLIASAVYCSFAIIGDSIFTTFVQADFASFQIFGGIVFLLIGLQFVFKGPNAIEILRGKSKHLAGAIAMPVLIGPGTLSACVVVGKRHAPITACGLILVAVSVSIMIILLLKGVHDAVRHRSAELIDRYIEIAGRITSLYVGTIAVEMVMQGLRSWADKF